MLTIWGRRTSSNVQKVVWAAEELGIAYRRIDAGRGFTSLDDPAYRALNPNGLIPVIDDDGFVLWESNAIVRYLAEKHGSGSLWPADRRVRADADRWMDWQATTLYPGVFPLYVSLVRTPAEQRDPALLAMQRNRAAELWTILDQALAGKAYVAGAAFTMGDIPVAVWAYRWFGVADPRPELPALEAWYARIAARPAFQRSVVTELT